MRSLQVLEHGTAREVMPKFASFLIVCLCLTVLPVVVQFVERSAWWTLAGGIRESKGFPYPMVTSRSTIQGEFLWVDHHRHNAAKNAAFYIAFLISPAVLAMRALRGKRKISLAVIVGITVMHFAYFLYQK